MLQLVSLPELHSDNAGGKKKEHGIDNITDVTSNDRVVSSGVLNEMVGKYDERAKEYKKIEETQFQLIDPAR